MQPRQFVAAVVAVVAAIAEYVQLGSVPIVFPSQAVQQVAAFGARLGLHQLILWWIHRLW